MTSQIKFEQKDQPHYQFVRLLNTHSFGSEHKICSKQTKNERITFRKVGSLTSILKSEVMFKLQRIETHLVRQRDALLRQRSDDGPVLLVVLVRLLGLLRVCQDLPQLGNLRLVVVVIVRLGPT